MIRTLIVDDEPLARKKIRNFLKPHANFAVIGECVAGQEAADAIVRLKPDVVFLDVRIPQLDGFQVLESVDSDLLPHVVFITAYDEYALRAFEVPALDYLLKPFNRRRFDETVSRIKQRLHQNKGASRVRLLDWLRRNVDQREHADRLVVKTNGRIMMVQVSRIEWIEAQGDYVMLHIGKESYLSHDTLLSLESRLNPGKFVRIHRSAIVNLDFVHEFKPIWSGDYSVCLRDGTRLTMSRTFRHRLQEIHQHQ